jgi:hypothetical protein
VKGAEVLLVTPSADFFAEPHVDSLIGYAKVFHAAGISWTLSSKASEAGNFGMFIGNYDQLRKIALRIREAALELGVKRIVVGECGHAWRVAYSFWNTLTGIGAGANDPFAIQLQNQLDHRYKQPIAHLRVTWDLIQRGALKFDKEANDHRIVTFHDSCNVARARAWATRPAASSRSRATSSGGGQPLRRDGARHHARGDLLLRRRRRPAHRRAARPARQGRPAAHGGAQAGGDDHGVNFMATICAICKAQFTKVLPYYGFKMRHGRRRAPAGQHRHPARRTIRLQGDNDVGHQRETIPRN